MRKYAVLLIIIWSTATLFSQEEGKVLSPWEKGEMEIHHIYTGRGESVFCIFPDGTTMLIDTGDIGPYIDPKTTLPSPDKSRQPGEWIARYIAKRMHSEGEKKIDYMFMTHFHGDHMGGIYENSPKTKKGGDYLLSGITEVGEYFQFGKMVDRDWPTYKYPVPQDSKVISNYLNFVKWSIGNNGMKMERFIPGTNKQFLLVNEPEKYKDLFEIRNIVSNGEVWTGIGNETRHYFPEEFPKGESPDENICSAGIRISYGKFDYFNGGDLTGRLPMYAPEWKDIETPVGKSVGPVEVCEVNHHAYIDAMCDSFISSVRPQVFVIQVWNVRHMSLNVFQSLVSQNLYPGKRDIFPTNIPEITKSYFGESDLKRVTGKGGHVVIKIEPGGSRYKVITLNTDDEAQIIKSVSGPYLCR
ncbi:MAG TPA: MBL fold metallo-hydrolase [Anaerovoracaceae bacterium]|nr:MBL fold metallo-hydrolase [Anaerovoracaceae bacterium]